MIDNDVKQNILSAVDDLSGELVTLASEMIQIPSINPTITDDYDAVVGGETKVCQHLKAAMEGFDLKTDLWEEKPGRANVVGVAAGVGDGRSLILNGHVDTVGTGPEELWTVAGPFSGDVLDGRIYGRGATDMKGPDAAALIALKAVLQADYQPAGDVILQFVSGEEMMNQDVGTSMAVKRGYTADAAIVVEPSSPPYRMGILTASPGVTIMKVVVEGKPAHTCLRDELVRAGGRGAEIAVSAVDKAMLVYQALLKLEEEWGQTKHHPAFVRPGHFTLCPTTFAGGLGGIAFIPEECYIQYVVWTAPQDTLETVKDEIETQISRFAATDPWLREHPPRVEWWDFWWPPYDVPQDAPICQAAAAGYEAALGEPAQFYGFAAVDDATFLNQLGVPAITMGPSTVELAHTANEYVEIQDLVDAARVYALTIVEWCGLSR
jgi:acetylornithine deacetylase/succinyl-diaminopimelate desuccinylase family protein